MRILYVEPFEAGSHASFTRALTHHVDADWTALTLPGRHWKWRMRGSAAFMARAHRTALAEPHDLLFASSFLPLAELVGLCPQLAAIPRVLYFHENQLTYPTRREEPRDHHFGFTQLVSSLAATRCWFNSAHNRDGFLAAGDALLQRMPDAVAPGWIETIARRSEVMPLLLDLPDEPPRIRPVADAERARGPVIVWNHRWEHDKDPEALFDALGQLARDGVAFRVAVCGQQFREVPAVFARARERLGERIVHFGHIPDRSRYTAVLATADIVVSTARHEFFGVSVLEAVHYGAYPLVPDALAYPELFPDSHRYSDPRALVTMLTALCQRYAAGEELRADRRALTAPYSAPRAAPRYRRRLEVLIEQAADGSPGDGSPERGSTRR